MWCNSGKINNAFCKYDFKLYKWFEICGVFKKRPNFLNSAPTSTESVLRLFNAPSVRFCQQTAICPVSLWALFFELQPLNWACAQATRRVSDKVTMKELEEQRARVRLCVCVKFCCKIFKTFMGMTLKPRCSGLSGWEKGLLYRNKHGWVGQRSGWCCLYFLIGKALFVMNLYHVVRR
jgi:hypothetical protein